MQEAYGQIAAGDYTAATTTLEGAIANFLDRSNREQLIAPARQMLASIHATPRRWPG